MGGAIGDALGMALEIFPNPSNLDSTHQQVLYQRSNEELVSDFQTGGPWQNKGLILQAGEWTDDTAMMLCLADSLLQSKTLNVADLMGKFVNWWFFDYNSCNGKSLGLGGNKPMQATAR